MRHFPALILLGSLLALGACAAPRQVESSPPTVTYAYQDNAQFDEIAEQADRYCEERYNADADLIDRRRGAYENEATFACV